MVRSSFVLLLALGKVFGSLWKVVHMSLYVLGIV